MTETADIAIFGAGGHAAGVFDALARGGRTAAAFIDIAAAGDATHLGVPVISEAAFFEGGRFRVGVIALGHGFARQALAKRIIEAFPGFRFAQVVHPDSTVSELAEIAPGSVVLAGARIGPRARIGAHGSIYANAVVEHDCLLADGVSLAPGAVLGGGVRIGDRSFVGMGAVISHNVRIGADTVVGAGAVVTGHVDAHAVTAGVPARMIRTRSKTENYL